MRAALGSLWLLFAMPALADDAAERLRILHERQAAEAAFASDEAACASRIAVTPCVDEVRKRRREVLRLLREQELVLDDRQRREKAAQRLQQIERNRVASEARQESAAAEVPAAKASLAGGVRPAGSSPSSAASSAAEKSAEKAARAAERAAAGERRRQEAEADRKKIQARVAEREAEGKKKAPLPLPAASAASR